MVGGAEVRSGRLLRNTDTASCSLDGWEAYCCGNGGLERAKVTADEVDDASANHGGNLDEVVFGEELGPLEYVLCPTLVTV